MGHLLLLERLAPPDICYYLSQGRYLIYICIVQKELTARYDVVDACANSFTFIVRTLC